MGASEPNAAFRDVIQSNVQVEHLHSTMLDQTEERPCLHHPEPLQCKLEACDLAVFGTPCNPFSDQRVKRYRDNSVSRHPLAEVTFRDATSMIVRGDHKCVVMEQVLGFDKREQLGSCAESQTPMRRPDLAYVSSLSWLSCTSSLLQGSEVKHFG